MNIIINATPVFGDRAIKRYTCNLITHLANIDNENNYFLFYIAYDRSLANKVINLNRNNFRNVVCKIPGRILIPLWNKINSPQIEFFTGKPSDVFHATDFDIPASKHAAGVFTLHGASYIEEPRWFPDACITEWKNRLDIAIKKCRHFIAVSEQTKKQFTAYAKVTEDRITVVPLGVGNEFYILPDKVSIHKTLKTKFNIHDPYLLYVGALERWKNINGLLDAFRILKEEKNIDHHLVLAGHKGQDFEMFSEKIKKHRLQHVVQYIGNISQETEDLMTLYNGAELFVFPSFVEGWTSPPLEAMKCGCPVVTSNVSSLPETVGDAALKVNPHSPEEIASATYKILTDTTLRQDLIQKGIEWSKQFTWERMAGETLSVYKHIYENMH